MRATFLDRKAIVDLDDAAFEPFWRLGAAGIRDALDATPKSRMRVGRGDPRVSRLRDHGPRGRVRVPAARAPSTPTPVGGAGDARSSPTPSSGSGSTGRRASYVNTQLENRAALELYEAFGFTLMPEGLLVLGGAL